MRTNIPEFITEIKEENFELFRKTIGLRIENHIKVEYVFQKIDYTKIPTDRIKPLGTAHAILCAKDKIHELNTPDK